MTQAISGTPGRCCLIVEDAPEMLAVGEYLRLVRQVRPPEIDEVDARQPILRAIS